MKGDVIKKEMEKWNKSTRPKKQASPSSMINYCLKSLINVSFAGVGEWSNPLDL